VQTGDASIVPTKDPIDWPYVACWSDSLW